MTPVSLRVLASLFFRLGATAFGGPASHIAMMEDEVVRRRGWLTHEEFLDLLGAANLIPGPNSTEMAIMVGHRLGGWRGLLLAGFCFILPAVTITLVLAVLYGEYGTVPAAGPMMLGIRAAVIAIILGAVARLGRSAAKAPVPVVIGLAAGGLSLLSVNPVLVLFGAGFVSVAAVSGRTWFSRGGVMLAGIHSLDLPGTVTSGAAADGGATLTAIGLFFLKTGAVLYGSGYVLVVFLQEGIVGTHHWLTERQLLDAVAMGQFTPGPVLSTATFVGYLLRGVPGALVATAGIFAPSFGLSALVGPFVPKLRNSPIMGSFLDGVNAAALGLMLAVCVTMGMHELGSPVSLGIFVLALAVHFIWSPNPAWIVLGSAIAGWALYAS